MTVGEPVWALAYRYPPQGAWTEEDYLAWDARAPRLELVDGRIEVLPVGTYTHQTRLRYLLAVIHAWAKTRGGFALPAGVRVRLRPGLYREPDVAALLGPNRHRNRERYLDGADLVVEIVSGSAEDRVRDFVRKRADYAAAGIPEYWIVDTDAETVLVLALRDGTYVETGTFARGQTLRAASDADLTVDVSALFDEE